MRMVTGLWWLSETCWTESLETQAARRLTGRLRKRGGRSPPEFTETGRSARSTLLRPTTFRLKPMGFPGGGKARVVPVW